MLGDQQREANRRRVQRDLAARDAAREWKRESQRLMLSTHDAWMLAPPLARHGIGLEKRELKAQQQRRRQQLRDRGMQVESRALRMRGLQ